jgi:hypothetical protein
VLARAERRERSVGRALSGVPRRPGGRGGVTIAEAELASNDAENLDVNRVGRGDIRPARACLMSGPSSDEASTTSIRPQPAQLVGDLFDVRSACVGLAVQLADCTVSGIGAWCDASMHAPYRLGTAGGRPGGETEAADRRASRLVHARG